MDDVKATITRNFSELQSDSRRLFHGRGCCFPGFEHLTVDAFQPVFLISLFREVDTAIVAEIAALLQGLCADSDFDTVLVQRRYLEGAPCEWLCGEERESYMAREGALNFELQLGKRQNTGFFLDMAPGRRWIEQHAAGKKVLNLFAYTCAFSVVAMAHGAASVVNADMSRASLKTGERNHRLNGQDLAAVKFLPYDIFRSWKRIRSWGPYDVVIIDPPSFQKGSFVAKKDYARLTRQLPHLIGEHADVLACLNAPELGENFVTDLFASDCPDLDLVGRLDNSVDFPDVDPQRQLKLFHYRR